ncbi:MAG: energy transducer TonB [Aquabacterium sp.]
MGTPSMPPLLAQGAHQEAPFWRRHEVDQGPIPLHPVIIPYPDGVQVAQVVRGIITLYIDELGVVRRVEPKDRTLAPAMVQAARDAFLQARFQPALRQQAPARVQIDIEVQFDPPEAPPGNRSLTPGL